jgi:hypothetical protein
VLLIQQAVQEQCARRLREAGADAGNEYINALTQLHDALTRRTLDISEVRTATRPRHSPAPARIFPVVPYAKNIGEQSLVHFKLD